MPLTTSPVAARKRVGELLVEKGLLTPEQLEEAIRLAKAWGVRVGDVATAKGWVRRGDLYQTLADHYESVYINLFSDPPDPDVFPVEHAEEFGERLVLPWGRVRGRLWVVAANPEAEVREYIERRFGKDAFVAFSSKNEIRQALSTLASGRFAESAVNSLAALTPRHSARQVFTKPQLQGAYLLGTLLLIALAASPASTLMTVNVILTIFLLVNFGFKLLLAFVGGDQRIDIKVTEEEVRELDDRLLPTYTVLVPMYKEPDVLPILAGALRRLDYPMSKLDIKLVLESEDHETINAARALKLEEIFEIIQVPPSPLKTKPKACNYALNFSRGELLTIFDAEDKPEPDQLKKVVAAFAKSPGNTACIQARLNYYNAEENWLTRMFTLEYSLWFDFYLPALEYLRIPIPLGGTSNHFRMKILKEVNAWDPFNVTEDADLGTRLTQLGYRVGVVNSTTFEEANNSIPNWIRQRSRWIKGYMQTWLVHMRNPLHLYRSLGHIGFWGFQFFIGGTVLTALITPLLYACFILSLISHSEFTAAVFPPVTLWPSLVNLLAGNAFFIYVSLIGAWKRERYGLMPWALTIPGYWILLSIAGYKAVYQLIHKPFFWEKTTHGISKFTAAEREEAMRNEPATTGGVT